MAIRQLVRRYGDQLVAAAIGALYLAEVSFEGGLAGHRLPAAAVAVVFAVALTLRRRLPVVPLLAGACVIALGHTVVDHAAETGAFLIGFIIAIYSGGRHASGRQLVACALLVLAGIPLATLDPSQGAGFGDWAFFTIFFSGPFVGGRIVRYRREREHSLLNQTAALELERDQKAREAVIEERTRIARELHDVVAHAVSVIVLQARGGRRMLRQEIEEAETAFDAIEHAGEQALVEMRRLLGMLRSADEELALAPQPSVSRIGDLAGRLSAAGLPVEVTIEGAPKELPPGVDVSAYRIVQEALTNALKHAGPARAHVIVRYRPDDLELEVLDDGAGNGAGGGTGHGLAGIRERVGIYGGELESGRRPEGGYALRARLPLTAA